MEKIFNAVERGVVDIASYNLGLRPHIDSEASLYRLVMARFESYWRC